MKKLFVLALGVATLTTMSCSNEEDFQANDNGPVEVKLQAVTTPATKAPVVGNAFEDGAEVTVLGLAKQQNGVSNWSSSTHSVFYTIDGPDTRNGVTGTINNSGIDFGGVNYYYPVEERSSLEYTFLASYPAQPWVTTETSTTRTFEVDGKTDYLFACAETEGGYNAKYFRFDADREPTLSFSHQFALIHFNIKTQETNSTGFTPATVTSIEILGLPETVDLTVNFAAQMGETKQLKVKNDQVQSINLQAFDWMGGYDAMSYTETVADEAEATLDTKDMPLPFGYLIVPPTSSLLAKHMPDGQTGYNVRVTYKMQGGSETYQLTRPLVFADGFKSGMRYDVDVTIYGFREIAFNVPQIHEWTTDENYTNDGIVVNE